MFEHVGYRNYRTFMEVARRLLSEEGLLRRHENFENAWPELAEEYDERFHRMWRYYLLSSAAGFRARKNQLWQIVLSPNGVTGGYESLR